MNIKKPLTFARALADENRQKIMELLCCRWLSVNSIVEQLHVTQPTVSHHLAVLRQAGLVKIRTEGRQSFYTLNQERLADCCGNLVLDLAPETETARVVKTVRVVSKKLS